MTDPDRIIVRPVSRQDYDEWGRLWDGYNAFYDRAGTTVLTDEITLTTWARFFDGAGGAGS